MVKIKTVLGSLNPASEIEARVWDTMSAEEKDEVKHKTRIEEKDLGFMSLEELQKVKLQLEIIALDERFMERYGE